MLTRIVRCEQLDQGRHVVADRLGEFRFVAIPQPLVASLSGACTDRVEQGRGLRVDSRALAQRFDGVMRALADLAGVMALRRVERLHRPPDLDITTDVPARTE